MCKSKLILDCCEFILIEFDGTRIHLGKPIKAGKNFLEFPGYRITQSQLISGNIEQLYQEYLECIAEAWESSDCLCTEMKMKVTQGNTVTYNDILQYFEDNGSFDDGSKGAEAINFIQYGTTGEMTHTYNGDTSTDSSSHDFGDSDDFNPISTDLSISADKKDVNIVFTVYKC